MLNYNNCSSNATCNNTVASFQCTCHSGYTGNGTFCEGSLNGKITLNYAATSEAFHNIDNVSKFFNTVQILVLQIMK